VTAATGRPPGAGPASGATRVTEAGGLAGALRVTDPEEVTARLTDRSGAPPGGRPAAVVLAFTVEQVQAVLADAAARGTPVVTRGAGTGLAGGAVATEGCIVLDVSGMDAIRQISAEDEVADVEPGVIGARLDQAAAALGLSYAPDPASAAISTIGGNIATNAGGLHCAKYGVTRESVLGLDVVLADGTLLRTGRRSVKGVAGYDLTALFVGSEGTLGVIVGATLRLRPRPAATATLAASFDDLAAAARGAGAITAARVQPAVAELLDRAALSAVRAAFGDFWGADAGALLLVQTDGLAAGLEAAAIERALAPLSRSVYRAEGAAEADALFAARRQALPALERLGQPLIEDIAVPRSQLARAAEAVAAIGAAHGVPIATIAHAADGNLHPLIVVDGSPGAAAAAEQAAGEIFALALELGGTVSGEHGVGLLKRRWLERELGPASLALQRQVKQVFDPAGLLNPGKAL
jgi:glycolate oxidase